MIIFTSSLQAKRTARRSSSPGRGSGSAGMSGIPCHPPGFFWELGARSVATSGQLWGVRLLLYRNRFSQPNSHVFRIFEIDKMYIIMHSSESKMSAEFLESSRIPCSSNVANVRKVLQMFNITQNTEFDFGRNERMSACSKILIQFLSIFKCPCIFLSFRRFAEM